MRKTRKVTILETRGKYCAGGERKVPWKHIERAPNALWEGGRMGGRRFWEASQEAGRCTEAQVVLEWELACEGEEGVSSGF